MATRDHPLPSAASAANPQPPVAARNRPQPPAKTAEPFASFPTGGKRPILAAECTAYKLFE